MRSLADAIRFFCDAHELNPAQRRIVEALWMETLRPYGMAATRAVLQLAYKEAPFRPHLPRAIQLAEEFICPTVEPVQVWTDAIAEARRSGPIAPDLHPAVAGVLSYVGLERLRSGENPTFLKAEVDKYVAFYNAKPFHERALLEGKATREQLKRLPSVEPWLSK